MKSAHVAGDANSCEENAWPLFQFFYVCREPVLVK
jgi:hypothetical protein